MSLSLRSATIDDVPIFSKWDEEPHVIAATTDDPDPTDAFGEDHYWETELAHLSPYSRYYLAELNRRPIGAVQIIDPKNEVTHYWGEIEANLRAIDIWIGEKDCFGQGFGSQMMSQALTLCFAPPEVTAVLVDPLFSNQRAHRFYRRFGFLEVERRWFNGEDDCLVFRLEREAWTTERTE